MFKIFTDEQVNEIKAAFIKLELKEVNESNGTFKVVASDETIDRHGEVIKVAGWDWHNFMKNPIMLINHNYWDLDAVGGKATQIYVDGGKLIIEGVFAGEEKAQQLRRLYDEGFINTVSVGFIPLKRNEDNWRIIEQAELLECSFVSVPANPNATRLEKSFLEECMKTGVVVEEEETTNEENNDQGDNVQENNEIQEVKALVVSLMETVKTLASGVDALRKELSKEDGNSNNEDDLKHKEWLQSVNRYTADKLRDYKASKSSK